MDVHHHSHSPESLKHKNSKKWTHYFWEFIMLFLAVFCGFLAENIREHKVEHIRAKQFARSLINDLGEDTIVIAAYKKTADRYISICDTLLNLSETQLEGSNATRFHFYGRFAYWTAGIRWNRTTFEQIKNSGSLRYFKHDLLEKLMKYDAMINDMEGEFFNHETRGNMFLNSLNKILEPRFHQNVSRMFLVSIDTLSDATLKSYLSTQTPSLESKRNEINEMLNMLVVQQRNLRLGSLRLPAAVELAKELIKEFSEEYHLK